MSSKPGCFGYSLSNDDWLRERGIEKGGCCVCTELKACVAAYNERVYNQWCDEDHEDGWGEDPDGYEPGDEEE